MAPKRKSTPSYNPLHSGASSSSSPSDPTPSHVQFCDEKAKPDFLENFSWRGIHSERHVVLLDFFNTDLPTTIHSRGWESFCGVLVTCPSVIIQEFYSNMHRFDYFIPQFSTHVRGIRMVVTPDIVSEVLHVPRVGILTTLVLSVWGQCPKTSSGLYFVRHLLHGVIVKTPHARHLLKVRESLTWWWHSFFIRCLAITLS